MKDPKGERLGEELEPPTHPGKPTKGMSKRTIAVLGTLIFVIVVGGIDAARLLGGQHRLSPDEFCASHGGVRYLSAGGWATPDTATCRDGHAGNVYP